MLQQNSEQGNEKKAVTTCTNMNSMPNQREENLTTAKVSFKSFLFSTMIQKAMTRCFLIRVFSLIHPGLTI